MTADGASPVKMSAQVGTLVGVLTCRVLTVPPMVTAPAPTAMDDRTDNDGAWPVQTSAPTGGCCADPNATA